MFEVKMCCLESGQIVAHLPREISWPRTFLLDTGVTAQLTGTHYRSPLFQGGLKIPCLVTVIIPGSIKGLMLIQ